ncbi:uncharacterized protein LOC133215968 [Neopsephotus bourkii]|uniref:uncharacterized protein LOC133215968 n=1 Tax=Neopsephotus bourkii TaxID=309878 RepID=UPI002AA5DDE8|nr:uncharacterized protein LOC133215968 [Neopsephotus bourkii]
MTSQHAGGESVRLGTVGVVELTGFWGLSATGKQALGCLQELVCPHRRTLAACRSCNFSPGWRRGGLVHQHGCLPGQGEQLAAAGKVVRRLGAPNGRGLPTALLRKMRGCSAGWYRPWSSCRGAFAQEFPPCEYSTCSVTSQGQEARSAQGKRAAFGGTSMVVRMLWTAGVPQHLRDELASLAAEIDAVKKVILYFGKQGRALSGQLVGFCGSAHTPHPLPGDAGHASPP